MSAEAATDVMRLARLGLYCHRSPHGRLIRSKGIHACEPVTKEAENANAAVWWPESADMACGSLAADFSSIFGRLFAG
jgi:hypothetical protein